MRRSKTRLRKFAENIGKKLLIAGIIYAIGSYIAWGNYIKYYLPFNTPVMAMGEVVSSTEVVSGTDIMLEEDEVISPPDASSDPDGLFKASDYSAEDYNIGLEGTNMKGLGYAFKAAAQETGINSLKLVALAIHESDYATNAISRDKNNIFSIGAYDKNPYKYAFTFKTKMACIAEGGALLKKNYLTKGGIYFHGISLKAMNVHYASDKKWCEKILLREAQVLKIMISRGVEKK